MRIAFLASEFVTEPNFSGGLAQYLGRIAPELVRRGHQVDLLVTSSLAPGSILHEGVRVHRVPIRRWLPLRGLNGLFRLFRRRTMAYSQEAFSTAFSLADALEQLAHTRRFDIVQAASWHGTAFFAASRTIAPVVVRVSSFDPLWDLHRDQTPTTDRKLAWWIEQQAMRRAAAVYAPSSFLAGEISRLTSIPVRVIRPPFYRRHTEPSVMSHPDLRDWDRYFFYFGRVCRLKGADLLASAIERLSAEDDVRLAIAGPSDADPAAEKLMKLARRFPDNVRYLGPLKLAMLLPTLRAAHAVVLPSLVDNLPNTCLESMGEAKTVIGPRGASFDEIIEHGHSGILFNLADAESLYQAMRHVWRLDCNEVDRIGDAAAARMQMFDPDRTIAHLENLFLSLRSPAKGVAV